VVIHRNKFAVAAGARGSASVQGPHCANPRKSTGAGDRFNAGYIFGLLDGETLEDCLVLGCATSGYFVRVARSAKRDELRAFMQAWENQALAP
jgi:sugar/nucleoside kinase (ribokinase family)